MKRILLFLRALIPTWRFFDQHQKIPVLQYRYRKQGEWNTWSVHRPLERRRMSTLLHNPIGNHFFACDTLMDQLAHDLERVPLGKETEFENCVSYRLTQQIVQSRLPPEAEAFQFRLTLETGGELGEDILQSPIHPSAVQEGPSC